MTDATDAPEQLFAKCHEKAQVADRKAYQWLLSFFAGALTFKDDLFGPEETGGTAPSAVDPRIVTLQQMRRQASRYRDLLRWLKEYPGREQRWIILAIWLKQEGICEPIEFLPAQVYDKVTAEKRPRVSITDIQHYHRVEAWRPYFERLLQDLRKNKSRDPGRDLERAGYDTAAINAARNKRGAIPAVCEWLASKLGVDASTLRNAHSRVSSKKRHESFDPGL